MKHYHLKPISLNFFCFWVASIVSLFAINPPGQGIQYLDNGDNLGDGSAIIKKEVFPEGQFTYLNSFTKFPGVSLFQDDLTIEVEYGSLLASSDIASDLNFNIQGTPMGEALSNIKVVVGGIVYDLKERKVVGAPVSGWQPDKNNDGIADWHGYLISYIQDANNFPTFDEDYDGIPFWIEWLYGLTPNEDGNPWDGTAYLPDDNAYLKYSQMARFILNLTTGMVPLNGYDVDGDGLLNTEEVIFQSAGSVNIRAFQDGDDDFIFQDNRFRVQHNAFDPIGLWNGHRDPIFVNNDP